MRNLFSVPIFFIVFRETLEAAIIVSVLLGLVEQIVYDTSGLRARLIPSSTPTTSSYDKDKLKDKDKDELKEKESTPTPPTHSRTPSNDNDNDVDDALASLPDVTSEENEDVRNRLLVKKLRLQIFLGTLLGFLLALSIGAAFIAIWFTQASDLWSKTEELWEGTFELIASIIIFIMAVSVLKMDKAKAKWRVKLMMAFEQHQHVDGKTRTGRWVLFILPLITVLREGMEAVIFVGGVSLGQPATSIPIAAVSGILSGLICGTLIYLFASRTTLRIFLICMTSILLLLGSGLFSRAVGAFQENAFNDLLGMDVDDAGGTGPGSYDVRGNVWHLDCCNPEATTSGQGWTIFNALLGWTNSATLGTVLSYIFYWLLVIIVLYTMRFKEGRAKFFGYESAAGKRRHDLIASKLKLSSSSSASASDDVPTAGDTPALAHVDENGNGIEERGLEVEELPR